MAQSKQKPARKNLVEGKTLVRGADGALYLLTKTAPPVKLTKHEARKLTELVEDAQEKLGKIIDKGIPRFDFGCHQVVHITIPDVFMD